MTTADPGNHGLSFDSLRNDLHNAANVATGWADFVTNIANIVDKYSGFIPGLGDKADVIDKVINGLDKAVHDVQNVIIEDT